MITDRGAGDDRVPDDKDPNGSRLEGPNQAALPVGLEFLGRPFEETKLFEIASAYERITRHRRPATGFGKILKGKIAARGATETIVVDGST